MPLAHLLNLLSFLQGRGLRFEFRDLFLVIAVLTGIALLVMLVQGIRQYRRLHGDTSTSLFVDLCVAHGLSRSERRLMQEAAASLGDGCECRVFVDPEYLRRMLHVDGNEAEAQRLLDKLF